jgi:hypothetical protein
MKQNRRGAKMIKTMEKASAKNGVLDQVLSSLNQREKRQLAKAAKSLDLGFLEEKVDLIKDTMVEIAIHRDSTPNALLQRNVWASLDAVALHLDYAGFTGALQLVAPKIFRDLPFDDPALVALEYSLMTDLMGKDELAKVGLLGRAEVEEVFHYAEKQRKEGLRDISRKNATMLNTFRNACGRPDKILDVIIHSPQAWKVVICVISICANAAALIAGLGLAETILLGLLGAAVCVVTVVITWVAFNGC